MTKLIGGSQEGAARVKMAEDKITADLAEKLQKDVEKTARRESQEEDRGAEGERKERQDEEKHKGESACGPDEVSEERIDIGDSDEDADEKSAKRQRLGVVESKRQVEIMYVESLEDEKSKDKKWEELLIKNPDVVMGRSSGKADVEFLNAMYEFQIKKGKYFVHEDTQARDFQKSEKTISINCNPHVKQVGENFVDQKRVKEINIVTNVAKLADDLENKEKRRKRKRFSERER
jgi:hypothetical protein